MSTVYSYKGEIHPGGATCTVSNPPDDLDAEAGACEADAAKGVKGDTGKLRWSLLLGMLGNECGDVVRVLMYGANRYPAFDNWKLVPNARRRYRDALARHLVAYLQDERNDPDSNLPHLAHVVANALFLAWFDKEGT